MKVPLNNGRLAVMALMKSKSLKDAKGGPTLIVKLRQLQYGSFVKVSRVRVIGKE